jgi:uncharacterized membrane protein YbhN (UPF0104 family)
LRKILTPIFGLITLCPVVWVLHRELRTCHLQEIMQELRALPAARLALAVLCAVASFIATTFRCT